MKCVGNTYQRYIWTETIDQELERDVRFNLQYG